MDTNYTNILQSKNLSFLHRLAIAKALDDKDSITTISKELNFTRKTIYDEIKRGKSEKLDTDLNKYIFYDIYKAQMIYDNSLSNRGRLTKVDDNIDLLNYVVDKLKEKYSPEVIAYLINEKENFGNTISARTIYNWIYNGELNLSSSILLYSKRKTKRKRYKEEKLKIKPNGGFSIELRDDIDNRVEFGHWEIDCVVGKRDSKNAVLLTIVERKTRYGIIIKIPSKTKSSVVNALTRLKKQFGKYFYHIFKSITADNGSEFKDAIGMSLIDVKGNCVKIYYTHAYSSWERGSNENFNKMIRRFFPKGTDFHKITSKKIKEVMSWINNYPRKQFNYKTALDKFEYELSLLAR